jgi:hypothetical protein
MTAMHYRRSVMQAPAAYEGERRRACVVHDLYSGVASCHGDGEIPTVGDHIRPLNESARLHLKTITAPVKATRMRAKCKPARIDRECELVAAEIAERSAEYPKRTLTVRVFNIHRTTLAGWLSVAPRRSYTSRAISLKV